jgi:hypothetical protein
MRSRLEVTINLQENNKLNLILQTLMQTTKIIQKKPGVSGGYACIRHTRITVWTLG